MSENIDRKWWPFPVAKKQDNQSVEVKLKIKFMSEATRCGHKAFIQRSDLECGALCCEKRACLIVWRGKHRAEVILTKDSKMTYKQAFSSLEDGKAFDEAASIALRWLNTAEFNVDAK